MNNYRFALRVYGIHGFEYVFIGIRDFPSPFLGPPRSSTTFEPRVCVDIDFTTSTVRVVLQHKRSHFCLFSRSPAELRTIHILTSTSVIYIIRNAYDAYVIRYIYIFTPIPLDCSFSIGSAFSRAQHLNS